MKTLDRYIVRTFLGSLLMWFVVFMALRVVVDLFTQMDEFTENQLSFLPLLGSILSYYFYQSFMYFTEMGGIIIVAAAAFAVARMNHTNELTAMLASGVSLHRVVWPIILAAMIMGGLIIIDQEFVIPNVRQHLVRDTDSLSKMKRFQVRFLTDGNHSVWFASDYEPGEESMRHPLVILRDEQFRYQAHVIGATASPARYVNVENQQMKGWMAHTAQIQRQKGAGENVWRHTQKSDRIYTTIGPQQLIQTARSMYQRKYGKDIPAGTRIDEVERIEDRDPHFNMVLRAEKFIAGPDAGEQTTGRLERPKFKFFGSQGRLLAIIVADSATWVGGDVNERRWELQGGRLFHATDLTKDELELKQSSRWLDMMSSSELSRLLELQRASNLREVLLTKYIRFADPFNNLIMLLLGLPFILSRERNIKASAGLCILMVGAFYVFIYICRYLGLPEFLAAFLPVLLFGPVSLLMLDSIKT